jgi:hypothetical protein
MRRKVDKRGKRSTVLRFILAKSDKDQIAAWNQELVRILHVFNVCPIDSIWKPANSAALLQTELAIDTNIRVVDTQTMVADTRTTVVNTQTLVADTRVAVKNTETMVANMYRNVFTEQKGASGQTNSVCATYYP